MKSINTLIQKVREANQDLLSKAHQEGTERAFTAQKQKETQQVKDALFFKRKAQISDNIAILTTNRQTILKLRKEGLSIRQIMCYLLKEWGLREYEFVRCKILRGEGQ